MAAPAASAPATPTALRLFTDSYRTSELYPTNIVYNTVYPAALRAYISRLDQYTSRLFFDGPSYVPFRDFTGIGQDAGLQKTNVLDDASLKQWLGDQWITATTQGLLGKKDPKCRFIFLNADSSRKPLKITRSMLTRILTYHQVMPGYLDFLTVFGTQNEARDLRFSGFREQVAIARPARALEIRVLGRSGRQYQLSYNLKSVACKSSASTVITERQWSIRQAAIHHQFDVEEGTTLWIVTHGQLSLRDRVQEMTAVHGRPEDRAFATSNESFKTSLVTHLLYCHWSTEEWRWYIQWLEEVIDQETNIAVYGTRGASGEYIYTPGHIQTVQHREDKINEAIMVLEANTKILQSLRDFYKSLMQHKDFESSIKSACEDDVVTFTSQVDDMIYNSQMQIARATVLIKITTDRKKLILQHLQGQATGKMEELTRLTIKIGTMSQREAITMRIIAFVTLVYLPATFVSTFFSTDVVKYQNQNSGSGNGTDLDVGQYMGSFSDVALFRWLQITLPLTVLTGAVGWFAYRRAGKQADKEFETAQLPT